MATFHQLQDIRVWHLSRQLARAVYRFTEVPAFRGDAALKNQLRRAGVSIVSNIAEGFERDGNKEFLHFLSQAKGSTGEVISQLYIARDQAYCDERTFHGLRSMAYQTLRMIERLMVYLTESDSRGKKFK